MQSSVNPAARIVVIGAGVIGASTAYALAKRGIDVTVVDTHPGPGLGTSYANAGMLTPSMSGPWNMPGIARSVLPALFDSTSALRIRASALPGLTLWGLLFLRNSSPDRYRLASEANYHLSRYSVEITRDWRDAEGLEFDGSDRPTIKFFRTEEAMAAPLADAEYLAGLGMKFDCNDRAATIMLEPALAPIRDRIAGSLSFPGDGRGNAQMFTAETMKRAEEHGAKLKASKRVETIVRDAGRVSGLMVDGALVAADHIVVAAGTASAKLASSCGIALPIKPVKGYSLTIDVPDGVTMPDHAVSDDDLHAAVTPLGRVLRVAGTAEFAGHDLTMRSERIANLHSLTREIYPDLADRLPMESAQCWTGLRPMSVTGVPHVGGTGTKGLWVNTGHGHLGWTMAAGSAEMLADMMTGNETAINPEPYHVERR